MDVKQEIKAEAFKMDVDGGAGLGDIPMATDDDLYEDAGDLEFYDASLPGDPNGNMYLVRVPPYVWEAWDKLDDDAEIQVGTLRQWTEVGANGTPDYKMRLLIDSRRPEHQGIPKEYELELPLVVERPGRPGAKAPTAPARPAQNTQIKNTYLFSEQDLPGFKLKNKRRADATAAGIPAHLLRQQEKERAERTGEKKPEAARGGRFGVWKPGKPRQEYFRKAIPKRTIIEGRVRHELNCAPLKNPETDYLLNTRARAAMLPKSQVRFGDISKLGTRVIGSGGIANQDFATGFIKTGAAPIVRNRRAEIVKHARMPENELLDHIFTCFGRFRFWSMRAMRAAIPQPEVYLRTTLEKVADLHRSGRFANNWELKPENRKDGSATEQTKASDFVAEQAESDDDDEVLEDVVIP